MRWGEAGPFESVDVATRSEQFPEGKSVTEPHTVGVDVLTEQRDLDDAFAHESTHLGQNVTGTTVFFGPAKRRHDAERAGVVATYRDRNQGRVRGIAPSREGRRKRLQGLADLHLSFPLDSCAFEQRGQRPKFVGAEHPVDPRRPPDDLGAVLLGKTTADGDLHVRPGCLDWSQVAKVAVQPVVGVLTYRTGIEDDDIRDLVLVDSAQAGTLEQSGQPL